MFQSPEGDSSLFYAYADQFVDFEDISFSPPKGIRLFSTNLSVPPRTRRKTFVSVPRRGFVSFLLAINVLVEDGKVVFQSPEGDSSLFYDD